MNSRGGVGNETALLRDERKMMVLGQHTAGKPKINVYSTAGQHIVTLTVRQSSRLSCLKTTKY